MLKHTEDFKQEAVRIAKAIALNAAYEKKRYILLSNAKRDDKNGK
jgi:hypothetical protein